MGSIAGEEPVRWEGGGGGERILVSVRVRPLNDKEIDRHDLSEWECINNNTIIFKSSVPQPASLPTAYAYDRVFGSECATRQVYEEGAKEVALSVVSGIHSSIFAYGQTSSGKTYTMTGITEYSVADIYDYIYKHSEREFVLKFSAIEIYNEAVKDLLSTENTPLRLLDDPERGTTVEKLTEETLRDQSHLKELLSFCEAQRQIGETSLNEMSSRSHQILRLTIESSARQFMGKDNLSTLSASVNFVDLAGSERASQALTAGTRLKEGCHINRSLLTLGTVIRKLSKGRNGHVPYRDSKLTRILQHSLGGNARTAIICTMSPARSHIEQTRNTLLFASCAKEVSTNARVNVVMSDKALVKHLQRELSRLESELKYPGLASHSDALRERESRIKKMEKEMKELAQQRDLALSRLEDLLRVVGEDQTSRQWDEVNRFSLHHESIACEDMSSISETSGVAYQIPDFDYSSFESLHDSFSRSEYQRQLSDLSKEQHVDSVSSPRSVVLLPHHEQPEIDQIKYEDSYHCKDVRCIEVDESPPSRRNEFFVLPNNDSDSLLPPYVDNNNETKSERTLLPETLDVHNEGDYELKYIGTLPRLTIDVNNLGDHEPKSKGTPLLTPIVDEDIHEVHDPKAERNTLIIDVNNLGDHEPKSKGISLLTPAVDEDIHEVHDPKAERNTLTIDVNNLGDHEPKSKGTLLLTPAVDEDICEVHDPKAECNTLRHTFNNDKHEDHEPVKPALEQEVQSGTQNNNFVKAYANVSSPWPSHIDLPRSRSLALSRSRSCRASLMTSPASLWFHEFEQSSNTPSDGFLKDLPAMPEGVRNRRFSVICDADTKPFSGVGYQSPEKNTHNNLLERHNSRTSSKDGISRHSSFVDELKEMDRIQSQVVSSHNSSVDGLKEMDQIQHQKQQTDNQEMEVKVSEGCEGCGVERNMKDVSMDPMQHPSESPSRWPFEFERKQKEIIELWHACHVSLVHRSCFFLLFKGDPSDSIYMEVEYRRLSFLRISSSVGNLDKVALGDGCNPTLASSMKTLRREREMLRKQMLKRLSAQERENLYTIWGIALDSKQRKQQLARRIWTDTNIEHVRDSASLVAKLIGLLEPGLALKEMFGLNFTPELTNFKSYSRHQRAYSLL